MNDLEAYKALSLLEAEDKAQKIIELQSSETRDEVKKLLEGIFSDLTWVKTKL